MKQRDPDTMESYLRYTGMHGAVAVDFDWGNDDIMVPDVTDRDTVVEFAKLTADAYVDSPEGGDWLDLGIPFNEVRFPIIQLYLGVLLSNYLLD